MSKSQNEKILDYMRENRGVTWLDAYERFGVSRLSARIYDLRQAGHKIDGVDIKVKNRYGEDCRVTLYVLDEEEQGRTA